MRWIDPEAFVAGEPNPYPTALLALLLVGTRVRAVVDPDDGRVGVRG